MLTILTSEPAESLPGAKFYVETEPVKAAEGILAHIKEKRAKLGI